MMDLCKKNQHYTVQYVASRLSRLKVYRPDVLFRLTWAFQRHSAFPFCKNPLIIKSADYIKVFLVSSCFYLKSVGHVAITLKTSNFNLMLKNVGYLLTHAMNVSMKSEIISHENNQNMVRFFF